AAETGAPDPLFAEVQRCLEHPPGKCLAPTDAKFAAVPDKDTERKPANLLTIPYEKVTGIEDEKTHQPYFANYWAYAWGNRSHVAAIHKKTLPDDAIGLAINSKRGRSLNQLHMHMDCLAQSTRDALFRFRGESGTVDVDEGNARGPASRQTYWVE